MQTARDSAYLPASCNRQHAPLRKSNMPPLTCPNRPPLTSAALQKQHAPANSPKPTTANKRRFAKEACLRQLTQIRHRKHPPLRKRSMPLLACPNRTPQTGAALQKATCLRQLTQIRNRKHPPLRKRSMPPLACPNPPSPTPAAPQKARDSAYLPKPATANTRRSAKEACPGFLAQTRHRQHPPLRKRSMPPLACPNPPPLTSTSPQKQHAPTNSPTPATANTRRSAKEACPCLLARQPPPLTGHPELDSGSVHPPQPPPSTDSGSSPE